MSKFNNNSPRTVIEKKERNVPLIDFNTDSTCLFNLMCEWAEKKAEEGCLNFDRNLCGGKFVRYWTDDMSKLIPDNENNFTSWKCQHHYFYEIIVNTESIGLQLAFSYKNISVETENTCETILNTYSLRSKKKDGEYRWPCTFKSVKVKNIDDVEIFEKMDALFNQMLGYESLVVYNLEKCSICILSCYSVQSSQCRTYTCGNSGKCHCYKN